jgi:hypothetical protein
MVQMCVCNLLIVQFRGFATVFRCELRFVTVLPRSRLSRLPEIAGSKKVI